MAEREVDSDAKGGIVERGKSVGAVSELNKAAKKLDPLAKGSGTEFG